MHMRTKKWAKPQLSACSYYIDQPQSFAGSWRDHFPVPDRPFYVELGCGKGVSTAKMVTQNRDINYAAIDIAPNVLGDVRRNLVKEYEGEEPQNVWIVKTDIEYIRECFNEKDRVDRIYINFCNPWTKREKHEKRRLTHPRQLLQYRAFTADDAEIWFKTDNDELFDDSIIYFERCGFQITHLTRDLHAEHFEPNYISQHEARYMADGVPIKFLIAKKLPGTWDFDATRWRRKTDQLPEEKP